MIIVLCPCIEATDFKFKSFNQSILLAFLLDSMLWQGEHLLLHCERGHVVGTDHGPMI